ncbi:hypothetical protein [Streptomyces sp. NPDC002054]|uniref:hypothetical protein n=1 Tax=Streptomyces sp. NPDC002054 TaxID=3154663 RepID=UPI00331A0D7E
MLWLYVQGKGWVLQPAPPAPSGCVITPVVHPGFGFTRTARATVVFTALLGLAWMWSDGHEIEVIGAALAAVLIEILARPVRRTVRLVRRGGAGSPWHGAR